MQAIVSIHNTTNERCWAEVLRWELSFHSPGDEEVGPKLKKFRGNFRKLSPKARMKMLFTGSKRPFDRHDWVVDRNGVEVRPFACYTAPVMHPSTRAVPATP